jgi:hypothetical protein
MTQLCITHGLTTPKGPNMPNTKRNPGYVLIIDVPTRIAFN